MQRAFSTPKRANTCKHARQTASRAQPNRRRDVLLAGAGAALLSSKVTAPPAHAMEQMKIMPENLSTFEKAGQRSELQLRAQTELKKVVSKADANKAMRLVFNDAATYNIADKTGGMNGSVVLNKEEAGRPENAGLSELVGRIGKAKKVIDDGNAAIGSAPLSWADTLMLAAKVAVEDEWRTIKLGKAATQDGGEQIVKAFGSAWDVRLGRVDSTELAPQRALAPGASAEEMRTFMLALGAKPDSGPFAPRPPFWERHSFVVYPATQDNPQEYEAKLASANSTFADLKKKYDQERRTTTRTNYEVDFIDNFTKLTALGAKFDKLAYFHPVAGVRLQ